MKIISWIFTVLILTAIGCKTKVMSEEEFTRAYVKNISSLYPNAKYSVKANYNEKEFLHYLDNAYNAYKAQPDSLDQLLERYAASSGDLYKDHKEIDINRIVPVIKSISYLDNIKSLSKESGLGKEPWVPYKKYNDDLIIVYAEDTQNSIRYFSEEDFNKLAIPLDSLLPLAIKNLDSILPEIQSKGDNGIFMITAGGDFEASLILFKSIWTTDNFKVRGEIVISIPNRDMLMITGSKDEKGIKTLKNITEETYSTGNYQVTPYLFKWDGVKFERFDL
jgi:uncharacterized protein YtpQ (UPF0354 family)